MSDLELNPYAQYIQVHELKARIAELESDRNAWRECAERLGRQVASLTHNIPTDIPLLGGVENG